jgi:hypothetical protein
MRLSDLELIGVGLGSFVAYYICDDWIGGAAILSLWLCIKLVATGDRLYVLPLALTFQWTQTTLGVFYRALTGREVQAHYASDYRPMVLIGLGCCLAMAGGIHLGLKLRKPPDPNQPRPEYAFPFPPLLIVYVSSIFIEGSLLAIAPDYPSFRQIITTLDTARLGILFLVLRRFCAPPPRWGMMGLIVMGEIVLGITGFFAGFREPIILAVLATLEVFDRRNSRHWLMVTVGLVLAVGLGLVWMGIRGVYRTEYVEMDKFANSRSARVERVRDLTVDFLSGEGGDIWHTTDTLVDRMWTIYYPALAVTRVPSVLPHTNGAIFMAALTHVVTPRIFFPNKGELMSDSDMVRKYANVAVAGREHGTSIAFGYAAESYIDYGLPLMFLPVFAFGVFVGFCYVLFRQLIWHRELFVAFGTVAFWLSVYLFERNWATSLGVTVGFMIYLGIPVVLLDRFLMVRVALDQPREDHGLLFDKPLEQDRF